MDSVGESVGEGQAVPEWRTTLQMYSDPAAAVLQLMMNWISLTPTALVPTLL